MSIRILDGRIPRKELVRAREQARENMAAIFGRDGRAGQFGSSAADAAFDGELILAVSERWAQITKAFADLATEKKALQAEVRRLQREISYLRATLAQGAVPYLLSDGDIDDILQQSQN